MSEVTASNASVGPLVYRRYWLHLYRRDPQGAQRILDEVMRHWPPQRIYLRLFEPALNFSGALFAAGRIGYRDEHFVTYHTLRFMRLVRRGFVPSQTDGPLALATGIVQESHVIGLRMVCDFLQWANWRIRWLPSNDRAVVADEVARLNPDAILLSMGLETSVTPAARLIADLRRSAFPGVIAVGGRAINCDRSLVEKIGADLTAPNAAAFVRALRPRFGSTTVMRKQEKRLQSSSLQARG